MALKLQTDVDRYRQKLGLPEASHLSLGVPPTGIGADESLFRVFVNADTTCSSPDSDLPRKCSEAVRQLSFSSRYGATVHQMDSDFANGQLPVVDKDSISDVILSRILMSSAESGFSTTSQLTSKG